MFVTLLCAADSTSLQRHSRQAAWRGVGSLAEHQEGDGRTGRNIRGVCSGQ